MRSVVLPWCAFPLATPHALDIAWPIVVSLGRVHESGFGSVLRAWPHGVRVLLL